MMINGPHGNVHKIETYNMLKVKTKVIIKHDDQQYNEFKAGEHGYIDGYVRGGEGRPYAVVVIDQRIVLVGINQLTVITE